MCVWGSLNKWNLFYRKNKATIISLNRMAPSKAAQRKTSQSFKNLIKTWVVAHWSTGKLNTKNLLIFLPLSMDKRNTVCLIVSKPIHLQSELHIEKNIFKNTISFCECTKIDQGNWQVLSHCFVFTMCIKHCKPNFIKENFLCFLSKKYLDQGNKMFLKNVS